MDRKSPNDKKKSKGGFETQEMIKKKLAFITLFYYVFWRVTFVQSKQLNLAVFGGILSSFQTIYKGAYFMRNDSY